MLKLFLLFFIITFSYALDIKVSLSQNSTISELEKTTLINQLRKRNINIRPEQAEKYVRDNRILADKYIKDIGLTDADLVELKIAYEEKLKDKLIDVKLNDLLLDDDILLSYYKDKKAEFYYKKLIDFDIYRFSNYNDSKEFYEIALGNQEKLENFCRDRNITGEHQVIELDRLRPELQILLLDDNTTNYYTTPQKFYKDYLILKVNELKLDGYYSFENVKEDIKKKLKQKIKKDTIKAVLHTIGKD